LNKDDESYANMLNFMVTEPSVSYAKDLIRNMRTFYNENGYLTAKQKEAITNIWNKAKV